MVARIRVRDVPELPARLPVEFAGLNDDAAERRAVTPEEFRCRVNHDVSAVLNRPDQVWGAECIVDHERQAVSVRDFSDRVNVRNIAVGIAECLEEDGSRIVLNGCLNLGQIMRIYEGSCDSVLRKCMCKEVKCPAVDGLLSDNMSSVSRERLNRVRDGCCPRCQRQRRTSAFKRRDSLLKNSLCGVGEPAVDITRISQTEAVRRVL